MAPFKQTDIDEQKATPLAGKRGGEAPAGEPEETGESGGETQDAAAAFAERAREVTQRIVELMGLDLQAEVTEADRQQVEIDIEGPDTRLIIGKHGQTLDALQHLVGLIANKDAREVRRVRVDAESYQRRRRERREEELLAMVRADAQHAKETGQEAVIQYAVGAYERRLVHMAFKDDPEFTTYSEGEEPNRYVVISPRD